MKHYLGLLILVGLSVSAFAQTCAVFPCVVASVSLTDQIQGIRGTPIFTPPASGIFRISAYLSVSKSDNGNALWAIYVRWTDDNLARFSSYNIGQGTSNAFNATWVVQSVGGQPLLYKIVPSGGAGGKVPYNLFIVVEQLQ